MVNPFFLGLGTGPTMEGLHLIQTVENQKTTGKSNVMEP